MSGGKRLWNLCAVNELKVGGSPSATETYTSGLDA